jgi:hypothetical protein
MPSTMTNTGFWRQTPSMNSSQVVAVVGFIKKTSVQSADYADCADIPIHPRQSAKSADRIPFSDS